MELYDTVTAKCPECGWLLAEQSKSGNCDLAMYPLDACPIEILAGVVTRGWNCAKCKAILKVKVQYLVWLEKVS